MKNQYKFHEKHTFLEKLAELVKSGISPKNINIFTPYPVHEAEEILNIKTSPLRFFTLIGALSGLLFGFFFTSWTSIDWPIIRGGKPILSFPAFIIVAFELTVLFGGVISFIGYLLLSKLPSVKKIQTPEDYGNQFVIHIESEG
jgi:molybdopterin-containing oxidoreductase family membrane subunit